jgi:hypothetical protein
MRIGSFLRLGAFEVGFGLAAAAGEFFSDETGCVRRVTCPAVGT